MIRRKVATKQSDKADRISELPEFILHMILSMLDPNEACRASVLSMKWYDAWSSIPVLDFQPRYFKEDWDIYGNDDDCIYDVYDDNDDDTLQRFLLFVDKTMQRYFTQKYRMKKLTLDLRMFDEKLEPLVDKWLRIAVENQIEELDIKAPEYRLPAFLFGAKSLNALKCFLVQLPYYEHIELISLEYLALELGPGIVDQDMLQRIISFSPLVELDISHHILENISLPWTNKVNKGAECSGSGTMQSNLKTSPLRKFCYRGLCADVPWSCKMNVAALKNLRKLEIVNAPITDCVVSELVYGLVSLESLRLSGCSMLRCIKISSLSLKEFQIEEGKDLTMAIIDAPNLLEFWYNCEVRSSLSLIRAKYSCNAHFFPVMEFITTAWFVKLKKFLTETNIFKCLLMDLSDSEQDLIEIEKDQLRNVATSPPFKLKELKLRATSPWLFTDTSLMAFLDGLFWSCWPDVVSITTSYSENFVAEPILKTLKRQVKCWKRPLKSIEVEGVDASNILSEPPKLKTRFRLSWSSF